MAYKPMGIPFKLSAEESGSMAPNYAENLMRGFQLGMIPRQMADQLLASKLANKIKETQAKYAEEQIKSDLASKLAQRENLQARTGFTSAQLKKIPYEIGLLQAQTGQAGAKSSELALRQKLMQDILKGGISSGSEFESNPQIIPYESVSGMSEENSNTPKTNQPEINKSNINYPQAAFLSKFLGMGEPKIINVDGQHIAVTPFGNVPIAKGLSEFQKRLTAEDTKKISNLEETYVSTAKTLDTLKSVGNILSSETFEEMRKHPMLGKLELKYYEKNGTPEQQKMVGQYLASTGEIIKDASRDFRGQFRIGEQALLNSMKPSPEDSADVARGKIEMLQYMVTTLRDRSKLASEYMRSGYSPIKAVDMADKKLNGKEIRKEIAASLNPKSKSKNLDEMVTVEDENGNRKRMKRSEAEKLIAQSQ